MIRAEIVRYPGREAKNNPRFVVTNLTDAPETVYTGYCGRRDVENRLKDRVTGWSGIGRAASASWRSSSGC